MVLIIGSYASASESGIHLYEIDSVNLSARPLHTISGIENPSFLTLSADQRKLFVISENKKGSLGQLNLYALKDLQEKPALRARLHFKASGSCFVSVDKACEYVFVANYGDGSLLVFKRIESCKDTPLTELVRFSGYGPNKDRQEGPHIHAALLSPDEKFLYCTDLGCDRIYRFHFDAFAAIPLLAADPHFIALPPGTGPRHMAMTSNIKRLYMVSELSGEIFGFSLDEGFSSWFQCISIIDENYMGKIEAGDIQIHPNGDYLYVSQRGNENAIIVLKIQPETGMLTVIQRLSSEGKGPRTLIISENAGLLSVANENSDEVTFFYIEIDGKLQYTGEKINIAKPTCLKILNDSETNQHKR